MCPRWPSNPGFQFPECLVTNCQYTQLQVGVARATLRYISGVIKTDVLWIQPVASTLVLFHYGSSFAGFILHCGSKLVTHAAVLSIKWFNQG